MVDLSIAMLVHQRVITISLDASINELTAWVQCWDMVSDSRDGRHDIGRMTAFL